MSNKDHNYTDDGSTLAEDEMKHSFLVRVWRFLEDHIAAILALFIPVWLGLLFVWAVVLRALEAANLLPSEKSHFLLTGGGLSARNRRGSSFAFARTSSGSSDTNRLPGSAILERKVVFPTCLAPVSRSTGKN